MEPNFTWTKARSKMRATITTTARKVRKSTVELLRSVEANPTPHMLRQVAAAYEASAKRCITLAEQLENADDHIDRA